MSIEKKPRILMSILIGIALVLIILTSLLLGGYGEVVLDLFPELQQIFPSKSRASRNITKPILFSHEYTPSKFKIKLSGTSGGKFDGGYLVMQSNGRSTLLGKFLY